MTQNQNDYSLSDLEDRHFWNALNDQLTISETPFTHSEGCYELDTDAQSHLRHQMIEDGYFHTSAVITQSEIQSLQNTVLQLHQNRIMPLFAALYDEFWQLLYKLRQLFTPALGQNYRLTPDFWIWHIPADDTARGWKPHRDSQLCKGTIHRDGTPTLCTVWLPLSDVETSNSCIYILPRKHDQGFQHFVHRELKNPDTEDATGFPIGLNNLPHVRALPVKAGEILGWDANLLHWGSASSQWAKEPRISIGIYYEADDATPAGRRFDTSGRQHINYDEPGCTLSFENRLTILANIIKTYVNKFDIEGESEQHFSPLIRRFCEKWAYPEKR